MKPGVMNMWKHWKLFSRLLSYFQVHFTAVLGVYAAVSPISKTVFVGQNVEFKCEIRDRNTQLYWIFDYNPDDSTLHYVFAEQTEQIETADEGHGLHYVEYTTEVITELGFTPITVYHLNIRIEGVSVADEGRYACGYLLFNPLTGSRPVALGDGADLTVLVPPNELKPTCSYSPNSISLPTEDSSIDLFLTCQMNDGKPPPGLTWYKGGSSISSTANEMNVLAYTLTAEDNGVQFTCVANSQSLQQDGNCSVIPLQINPSVSISHSPIMPVTENSEVTFMCLSSGLPMISKVEWRYNGQTLTDSNAALGLQITALSESSPHLSLNNIQLENNNDVITCYVEIPSGLNAMQSVTIMVKASTTTPQTLATLKPATKSLANNDTSNESGNKDSSTGKGVTTSLIMPVAGAVGGLIVFLIIAIVITVICRRNGKQRTHDNSQRQ